MTLLAKASDLMATYAVKAAENNAFQGIRLTRRGRVISRLAVVLSVLILIASSYSAIAGVAAGEDQGKTREHLEVIVVAPGESLWSIAKLLDGDQEENLARIIELNALKRPALSAGTRLIIPTRR
jgi:hypothetical protein